jgi:hypothetical protein
MHNRVRWPGLNWGDLLADQLRSQRTLSVASIWRSKENHVGCGGKANDDLCLSQSCEKLLLYSLHKVTDRILPTLRANSKMVLDCGKALSAPLARSCLWMRIVLAIQLSSAVLRCQFLSPAVGSAIRFRMIYCLLRVSKSFIVNHVILVYQYNRDVPSNGSEGRHSWQAVLTRY